MGPHSNPTVPGTHARTAEHIRLLLSVGYRNVVTADNVEAAFEKIQDIVGRSLSLALFHDAVAACLRDGLIHDPVRLPEHSLQCHWRLELTATGLAMARSQVGP